MWWHPIEEMYLAWPTSQVMVIRATLGAYIQSVGIFVFGVLVGIMSFWMLQRNGFDWTALLSLVLGAVCLGFGMLLTWKTATTFYWFDLEKKTLVVSLWGSRQTIPFRRVQGVRVVNWTYTTVTWKGSRKKTTVHYRYGLTIELDNSAERPSRPRPLHETIKLAESIHVFFVSGGPEHPTAIANNINEVLRYGVDADARPVDLDESLRGDAEPRLAKAPVPDLAHTQVSTPPPTTLTDKGNRDQRIVGVVLGLLAGALLVLVWRNALVNRQAQPVSGALFATIFVIGLGLILFPMNIPQSPPDTTATPPFRLQDLPLVWWMLPILALAAGIANWFALTRFP